MQNSRTPELEAAAASIQLSSATASNKKNAVPAEYINTFHLN